MQKDFAAIKKDREAAIFEASLRVIKQKGYHKARMSDIAREAKISYGLVYHYFKNKETLFDAIFNRWWYGVFFLMEEIVASEEDVKKKLERLIHYFFDTYQRDPELVNIFITEISRSTANLTRKRLEPFKKFMSLTEQVMLQGQRKGILRADFKARYLTYIFLGALETFISAMVLADLRLKGDLQKDRIAHSVLEVFLNGAKVAQGR
jgi:TetR/AcrR family fatty acid metabolism transcriptional regulator